QKKPDIKIRRMSKDGIRVGRTVETEVDDETVMAILKQFRIMNAEVLLRDPVTADQFIDCIENNKAYVPAITVVNKTDILSPEQKALAESLEPSLFIAAQQSQGLEELKDLIFDSLNFIRVYLKEINNKADMDEPLIMRKGATLKDVCAKLHKDFIKNFKFARIWGPSAKFDGQQLLKLNHTLQDQDVLEIHVR
ncbi:MAG: TGS domain-containing protein, partial [Candidatus Woesearchaeota archaeon]